MQPYRHAGALADEVSRYLEAIELSRVLGLHVTWRSEAVELSRLPRGAICDRCANPLVRMNGRHICFGS